MAFSNDENLLNGINLDSIIEYQDFVKQLQPILLKEAGYETTTSTKNPFGNYQSAYDALITNGKAQGLSLAEVAKKNGLSVTQAKEATSLTEKAKADMDAVWTNWKNGGMDDATYSKKVGEIESRIQGFSTTNTALKKTAEREELEKRYKEAQDQQLELTKLQGERQTKALKGEIPTSPILAKQIQDEFNTFKENQARAGNVIMGDDIDNAVGKGTAAIENLRAFKDNSAAAKQREIEAIIQGETPLFYQGLGLAGGYGGVSTPTPTDYAGVSGLSLQGQQPFQFERNWDLQRFMANKSGSKAKGNTSGLVGSLAGAGIGAMFGGLPGATLGSQMGGGVGTLFSEGY